ncbi:hypothetical protein HQ533_00465 [Candidatus Woesearchaeota archaeon]|nr:hypothetical protein [Candidatus Woesearchaeota archaeon]
MNKSLIIALFVLSLVIGALLVSGHLPTEEPAVEKTVQKVNTASTCPTDGCTDGNCPANCGGSCGVPTCGCSRK